MLRLPLSRRDLRSLPSAGLPAPAPSSANSALLARGIPLPATTPAGGGAPLPALPRASSEAGLLRLAAPTLALGATDTARGPNLRATRPSAAAPSLPHRHPRRSDLPLPADSARHRVSKKTLKRAVALLEWDKYTVRARVSVLARKRWWAQQAATLGFKPRPLTVTKLKAAAAALKAAKYRSAEQYLYAMRKEHLVLGHSWSEALAVELRDSRRSCGRGLGPARQAQPLPLDAATLRGELPPPSVLLAGVEVILTGCWFLLREIEVANIRVEDLVLGAGAGCGSVTLNISVSKTDPCAKGAYRTLGCACPSLLCPVAAARRLALAGAGLEPHGLLVRNLRGQPATKAEVVREIRALAKRWGAVGAVTGHSMRVTGAQRLAMAGIAEGRIAIFGRWVSKAMLLYVREALLGAAGGGIAEQVEKVAPSPASITRRLRELSPTADADSVRDFIRALGDDPATPLQAADLDARWAAHCSTLQREIADLHLRAPPPFCKTREGRIHIVRTHRFTKCGWNWSAAGAVAELTLPATCRKCTGTSIRWGRLVSAAASS